MVKKGADKKIIWWIIGIIVIIILVIIFLKYTGYAVASSDNSCRDNDGGINYKVQGTIAIGNKIVWEDYCDIANRDLLYEGFCDGNSMKKQSFICPYGCLMGICKKCPSKTCAQLAKKCGNWDDECGAVLNCGTCSVGQICSSFGVCILTTKEVKRCSDLSAPVKKTISSIMKSTISLKEGGKVYSDIKLGPNLFVLNNKQGGAILKVDNINIGTATDGSISLSDYVTKDSIKVLLVNVDGIYKKEGVNIFGASNIKIQVDSNGKYAVVNWPLDNEIDTFVQCS